MASTLWGRCSPLGRTRPIYCCTKESLRSDWDVRSPLPLCGRTCSFPTAGYATQLSWEVMLPSRTRRLSPAQTLRMNAAPRSQYAVSRWKHFIVVGMCVLLCAVERVRGQEQAASQSCSSLRHRADRTRRPSPFQALCVHSAAHDTYTVVTMEALRCDWDVCALLCGRTCSWPGTSYIAKLFLSDTLLTGCCKEAVPLANTVWTLGPVP